MVLPDSHGISRVPRYSGTCPASQNAFAYGAVTLYGCPFQGIRLAVWLVTRRPCGPAGPTTPPCKHDGLGYVRVRSPLLAESLLISLPAGTEMVHFPALPSARLWIQRGIPRDEPGWVSPFGNLRVKACLRLTGAYRSLPRPSSPSCAKASTVRP
jgi:hypothetical protein